MTEKYIDEGIFYLGNKMIVLELSDCIEGVKRIVYDNKNTILIYDNHNVQYVLQNVVPEVRKVLKNKQEIVAILRKKNRDFTPFVISLEVDESLDYEDNFLIQAKKLYLEIIKTLKRVS